MVDFSHYWRGTLPSLVTPPHSDFPSVHRINSTTRSSAELVDTLPWIFPSLQAGWMFFTSMHSCGSMMATVPMLSISKIQKWGCWCSSVVGACLASTSLHKLGVMLHICSPSTVQVEVEEVRSSRPASCSVKPCIKRNLFVRNAHTYTGKFSSALFQTQSLIQTTRLPRSQFVSELLCLWLLSIEITGVCHRTQLAFWWVLEVQILMLRLAQVALSNHWAVSPAPSIKFS